jgi:hypothetical protein
MPPPLHRRQTYAFSGKQVATRTEYTLIAAGMGFAIALSAVPPSIIFAHLIAAFLLLLAWGAAECWVNCRRE